MNRRLTVALDLLSLYSEATPASSATTSPRSEEKFVFAASGFKGTGAIGTGICGLRWPDESRISTTTSKSRPGAALETPNVDRVLEAELTPR